VARPRRSDPAHLVSFKHLIGASQQNLNGINNIKYVCPMCFSGQIAGSRAPHRYGVEHHSSMEAFVADLASEDN
jgi:hypothetical protein